MVDRGDYAEALLPLAAQFVSAVREEGPAAVRALLYEVRAVPRPEDVDPIEALAVVVAALVPDDRTVAELLDWLPRRELALRCPQGRTRETPRETSAVSVLGATVSAEVA